MAPKTHRPEYREMLARLRAAREEAGVTQIVAARHLELTQSSFSKLESGERRIDPIELALLASLYGTDVRQFVPPWGG